MTHHKVLRSILTVIFVAACALVGCAQRPAPTSSGGLTPLAGTSVTVTGKIRYMKSASTYVVQGEAPPNELFILNEDPRYWTT